jgi:surface antigen
MSLPYHVRVLRLLAPLLAAVLSACASSSPPTGPNLAASSRHPGLTCAPFARELSGIALYGDADTWWDGAAGRYDRASHPTVGSVLVLRRSGRLPSGHVAVVSRLLTPLQVLVIEANWVPGELDEDQLVVDVSERNDWSSVRVWYPPINQLGSFPYPAFGFILPPQPATHEQLVRAVEPAAYYAIDSRGRQPPRARLIGG